MKSSNGLLAAFLFVVQFALPALANDLNSCELTAVKDQKGEVTISLTEMNNNGVVLTRLQTIELITTRDLLVTELLLEGSISRTLNKRALTRITVIDEDIYGLEFGRISSFSGEGFLREISGVAIAPGPKNSLGRFEYSVKSVFGKDNTDGRKLKCRLAL